MKYSFFLFARTTTVVPAVERTGWITFLQLQYRQNLQKNSTRANTLILVFLRAPLMRTNKNKESLQILHVAAEPHDNTHILLTLPLFFLKSLKMRNSQFFF